MRPRHSFFNRLLTILLYTDDMRNDKGNVLFVIFIAVLLFGALSYAMTQSGRGTTDIKDEEIDLAITEVLNYMASVRMAVDTLILTGACTEFTVRFWHQDRINAGNWQHYGDGSNPKCQIFNPAGGGVPYKLRPKALGGFGADEYVVSGAGILGLGKNNLSDLDGDGNGDGAELIIWINVPVEACLRVNKRLGINNQNGSPPKVWLYNGIASPGSNGVAFPWFEPPVVYGTGGSTIGNSWSGASSFALNNRVTGCLQDLTNPFPNVFYHVVLIR